MRRSKSSELSDDPGKGVRIRRGADVLEHEYGGGLRRMGEGSGGREIVNEEKPVNYFEFRDVCKSFDERLVLDQVSFTVKRGETCVIMGRSGVGKSVSLKHIMGFLKADSGRILIDGQDVTDYKEEDFEDVRRRVA